MTYLSVLSAFFPLSSFPHHLYSLSNSLFYLLNSRRPVSAAGMSMGASAASWIYSLKDHIQKILTLLLEVINLDIFCFVSLKPSMIKGYRNGR